MTISCSYCPEPAVLQWRRKVAAPDIEAHRATVGERQAAVIAERRVNLMIAAARARNRLAELDALPSDPSIAKVRELWAKEADELDTQLEAATTEQDTPPLLDATDVSVFGCTTHAVDLESAARLHEADCADGEGCTCTPSETG